MRLSHALVCLFLLGALSPAARADQGSRLVSVFPIQSMGQNISKLDKDALDELVRSEAGKYLTPHGYVVLTGETQFKLLEDNGYSEEEIERACDQSCVLGTARELNIAVFVSGSVSRLEDGGLSAFIRVYNTVTGQILASTGELHGANLREVRQRFTRQAEELFRNAVENLDPSIRERRLEAERRQREEERREREADRRRQAGGGPVFGIPQDNPLWDFGGRLVVRGGLGALNGVLGVGAEYHERSWAVGIGVGSYMTLGGTWKPLGFGRFGGPYVDGHIATAFGERPERGFGVTAGYDLRLVPWVSLKGGLGAAWTTLSSEAPNVRPLVLDLSAGLVF